MHCLAFAPYHCRTLSYFHSPYVSGEKSLLSSQGASEQGGLDQLATMFDTIQHKYPREYRQHNLASLAVALVFPEVSLLAPVTLIALIALIAGLRTGLHTVCCHGVHVIT